MSPPSPSTGLGTDVSGLGLMPTNSGDLGKSWGLPVTSAGTSPVMGLETLWITLFRLVLGFSGTRSPPTPAQLVAGAAAQVSDLDRKRWLSCRDYGENMEKVLPGSIRKIPSRRLHGCGFGAAMLEGVRRPC
jgi:hypothetical protein